MGKTPKTISSTRPVQKLIVSRFENHRPLVTKLAKIFTSRLTPFAVYDDLYHWGLIGLWQAASRYTGIEEEFPLFANVHIRGRMIDEFRKESKFIRTMPKDAQPVFQDAVEAGLIDKKTSIEENFDYRRTLHKVLEEMSYLEAREELIVSWYFFEGLSLKEIALELGVTEARISQLKTIALQKLAIKAELNVLERNYLPEPAKRQRKVKF
ncbi:MAG: sigma-70 family RNA polymerase sigma factor [Lentisphaeria bacterium]